VEKDIRQNNDKTNKKTRRPVLLHWLLRVLQGIFIGAGAILPGISGGVLCVVFGIYQPMMALLAHPFRAFKNHYKLLFPVLVGWAFGFWGFAKVVDMMFNDSAFSTAAIWLFFGLIVGMMPQLYNDAGKEKRSLKSWLSFIISFVLIMALLVYLQYGMSIPIKPNLWWYLVCGALWGASLVVPGLSSSSLLLFLGLYQSMSAGISAFSLEVILPMAVGIAATILLSARSINYMFQKHHSVASHAVMGFVMASAIAIILPTSNSIGATGERIGITYTGDIGTILIWIVCFAAGFAVAWLMDRAGKKILARPQEEQLQ
jgi:putative membrane protein